MGTSCTCLFACSEFFKYTGGNMCKCECVKHTACQDLFLRHRLLLTELAEYPFPDWLKHLLLPVLTVGLMIHHRKFISYTQQVWSWAWHYLQHKKTFQSFFFKKKLQKLFVLAACSKCVVLKPQFSVAANSFFNLFRRDTKCIDSKCYILALF